MENLIGTEINGCRIESKIGQGGMGAVYKAHHLALDIPVAVKVLATLTVVDKARERFLREARIAAKLRHPHIVGVLNVGTERDIDFIVMEYVEGKNLREVINERGAIPRHEALQIARQVLEALRVAKQHGIVHRDIKPENIMIDSSGNVRLTDLGLARGASDANLTQTSVVLGSPYYVAPEQADNPAAADIRADIYSLGCTLFHMLTGTQPFTGTTPMEIILNHMRKPVPRLREVNPAFPEALDNAVYTMMQKAPLERYQTPEQALSALKAAVEESAPSPMQQSAHSTRARKKAVPVVVWFVLPVIGAVALGVAVALLVPQKKKAPVSPVAPTITAEIYSKKSDSALQDTAKPAARTERKKRAQAPVPKPVKKIESEQQVEIKQRTGSRDHVLSAVKTGDTEGLLRLLNEGGSPNGIPGSATTPLHEAVRRGMPDLVKILTERGANPNIHDSKGDVPLHYALREDAQLIVSELLKHGADANIKDHRGKTPLEIAGSISSELESMVRQYGGK
jgi:predicted Ser/Thr protein kinase